MWWVVVALWMTVIFLFVLCRWVEIDAGKKTRQTFLESDYWAYMEVVKTARFCQAMIIIVTVILCLAVVLAEVN